MSAILNLDLWSLSGNPVPFGIQRLQPRLCLLILIIELNQSGRIPRDLRLAHLLGNLIQSRFRLSDVNLQFLRRASLNLFLLDDLYTRRL